MFVLYGDYCLKRRKQYMQSEILSNPGQIVRAAKSWFIQIIDSFSLLLSIWTETKNDGDTLKIRKKGVN